MLNDANTQSFPHFRTDVAAKTRKTPLHPDWRREMRLNRYEKFLEKPSQGLLTSPRPKQLVCDKTRLYIRKQISQREDFLDEIFFNTCRHTKQNKHKCASFPRTIKSHLFRCIISSAGRSTALMQ